MDRKERLATELVRRIIGKHQVQKFVRLARVSKYNTLYVTIKRVPWWRLYASYRVELCRKELLRVNPPGLYDVEIRDLY